MKKRTFLLMAFSIIVVIVILVLSLSSFNLAVMFSGLSTKQSSDLFTGFNDSGNMFKIILTTKKDKNILACVEKNNFGIWTVTNQSFPSDNGDIISIGWMKTSGERFFSDNENSTFETEWNVLYYGENALTLIEFDYSKLPQNVTLNIQQSGETYLLHFVSYDDESVLSQIDIYDILSSDKSIPLTTF